MAYKERFAGFTRLLSRSQWILIGGNGLNPNAFARTWRAVLSYRKGDKCICCVAPLLG